MEGVDFAKREDLYQLDERLSAEIRANRDRINTNTEDISELKAMYLSVAELPKTINSLEKTIISVCNSLENIDKNMKHIDEAIVEIRKENHTQNQRISEVDNKSKVDWAKFITENFWKILVLAGGIYYVAKDLLSGMVQ